MTRVFRSKAKLPGGDRDIAIRIASLLLISGVIATCSSTGAQMIVDAGPDQAMETGADQATEAGTDQATEGGTDQAKSNAIFGCGPGSGECRQNQNYCVVHSGGAGGSGGQGGPAPTTYTCKTFRANCARTDCTCLQSDDLGCMCSEQTDGEVFVQCLSV